MDEVLRACQAVLSSSLHHLSPDAINLDQCFLNSKAITARQDSGKSKHHHVDARFISGAAVRTALESSPKKAAWQGRHKVGASALAPASRSQSVRQVSTLLSYDAKRVLHRIYSEHDQAAVLAATQPLSLQLVGINDDRMTLAEAEAAETPTEEHALMEEDAVVTARKKKSSNNKKRPSSDSDPSGTKTSRDKGESPAKRKKHKHVS